MPRLRCPRCDHVFAKPEGTPTCPSCAYAPSPSAAARAPVDASPTPESPVRDEGLTEAGTKREAKRVARFEAAEARKRRKAEAKAATQPSSKDEPGEEGSRASRRFFAKKRYGKLGKRLMIGAITTFLTATLLPFAGTFDAPTNAQQAQAATLDLANGHFVLQRDGAGAFSFAPYFTQISPGVEMDGARLGEAILLAGMALLLLTRILGARRPGFVVVMAPVGLAILMGGAFLVQQALADYPGDVFPFGPVAIYGGVVQVLIAVTVALIYALKRPQPDA
ncbi:MAG: hypothetical protein AABX89_02935 [Candidatus Thermoplasmatota archaeon]